MLSPRSARPRLVVLAVGLLALAGCGESDDIRTYTAPRASAPPIEARVRLLAAIFDHPPEQWYFHLLGPTDAVGHAIDPFVEFLQSVRLTKDKAKPIEWKLPANWKQEKGSGGLRYATLYLGEKGKAPEVGVFRFDRVSPVLENVNRWAKEQLGRPPIAAADLPKYTRPFQAGPHAVTIVDLVGPGLRGPARPGAGGGGLQAPREARITYDTPPGWKQTGGRVSTRMGISVKIHDAFAVGDGKKAETTVQVFPSNFGEWTGNINRWRGEVGLEPLTPAQANKSRDRMITAGGATGPYLSLVGPTRSSLIVVLTRGGQAWFFKLVGDKDVVAANREKFEAFVRSVQFPGAADE